MALNAGFEVGFCDGDVEVAATEVGRDGDGDVEVADCLGPFVGELGLFGGFFGTGFLVFFLTFFGGGGGGHFCCKFG